MRLLWIALGGLAVINVIVQVGARHAPYSINWLTASGRELEATR